MQHDGDRVAEAAHELIGIDACSSTFQEMDEPSAKIQRRRGREVHPAGMGIWVWAAWGEKPLRW